MTVETTRRRRYTPRQRIVILVPVLGAIGLLFASARFRNGSIGQARFELASNAVFMVAITLMCITDVRNGRRVDPWWLPAPLLYAIYVGVQVGKHPDLADHAVLTAVSVIFFLAPLPLFAVLIQRQRDEFERSVIAQSALVSLAAFLIGGFGYAVLARVDHLPNPTLFIVVPALAGLWLVTHIVLWLMRT
jgi:hypothetical protein